MAQETLDLLVRNEGEGGNNIIAVGISPFKPFIVVLIRDETTDSTLGSVFLTVGAEPIIQNGPLSLSQKVLHYLIEYRLRGTNWLH